MAKSLKILRTLHSYLGILALPWIIFFGVTGLYLNHPDTVLSLFPYKSYTDSAYEFEQLDAPLTAEQASEIARPIWPQSDMKAVERVKYHGYDTIHFVREAGTIIVAAETGHYYVKSNLKNTLYSPNGEALNRKIYWNYVLGVFHRTGWLGWSLGTILADITAITLIAFGLSGVTLWYLPRHKRFLRRVHFSK